ncbi:MAG: cardiolipin synthase [Lachnospiraceae bacterium]
MKKFLRVFFKIVFSRTMIILLSILIQATILFGSIIWLGRYTTYIYGAMTILGAIVLIYLINKEDLPEFKIAWVIPICVLPVFGTILFMFVDKNFGSRSLKREMNKVIDRTEQYMKQDQAVLEDMETSDDAAGKLAYYLSDTGGYPAYRSGKNTYFKLGEDKWQDLLTELKKAEHFIFLEYFIVEPGIMWDSVLEILTEKAKSGVEVRFMYDGMCSLLLLPYNYPAKMEKLEIKTKAFSPIAPLLSTHQNNRDHRKILVIDGKVAYTGGVNLADEYINKKERFGHWKDVAVKVTGEAVDSFTMMFLRTWDILDKPSEYEKYLHRCVTENVEGFVIPYGDGPNRKENVAEKVYLDILNTAQKYVHIMTPYFIVDSTFLMMLKYAAQRGVEVKLILPHIPDKKYAFAIARTYYPSLLAAGVQVYEYTPGFVHAKLFTSDDCKAVIGTINLDYRSLYHHFECAAYFYKNAVVSDVEADFQETLKVCQQVTPEYYKSIPVFSRIFGHICNLIAPLM